jgi:hypothetical protein
MITHVAGKAKVVKSVQQEKDAKEMFKAPAPDAAKSPAGAPPPPAADDPAPAPISFL